MMISVILGLVLYLVPPRPAVDIRQPPACPTLQEDPTGEAIEDFCQVIELRTKCGEKRSTATKEIKLPPGFTRVDVPRITGLRSDGVEVLKKEPQNADSDCQTTWDARSKSLRISCVCEAHDRCTKDTETAAWSGPESELKVRVHLFVKKEQ